MEITDANLIEQVLSMRTRLLHQERDMLLQQEEYRGGTSRRVLLRQCRNNIGNRHFDDIRRYMLNNHNIQYVIFGTGGAQTQHRNEMDRNGENYIHIRPEQMSEEADLARGF